MVVWISGRRSLWVEGTAGAEGNTRGRGSKAGECGMFERQEGVSVAGAE